MFSIFSKRKQLKEEQEPSPSLPALFCMTCHEEGKTPFYYSLNRNNSSTIAVQ